MKKIIALSFLAVTGVANAGQAEIRMSQKMIDINNGSFPCGKIVKAEKVQDTSKFLDVGATCSNGEHYRMTVLYGSARDIKVVIRCSTFNTNGGFAKEAAQELGITKSNCVIK
jgi:hypothetical protein